MIYKGFAQYLIRAGRLAAALALGGSIGFAGTVFNVPATTDIWLAGQSTGASVSGFFGTDTVPDNSPVEFDLSGQTVLTFAASGSTSVDGSCFAPDADGGCYSDEFSFSPGPANGISLFHGPSSALVGVFLDNTVPTGPSAPPPLDFTGSNASFTSLAPLLDQTFFIGDGLTGDGTGAVQQFIVPTGATRLFLAVSDSVGASTGNLGSITAIIDPTPEPSQWMPLAGALAALGLKVLRRKR